MPIYHYNIKDRKIAANLGEIPEIPKGFNPYQTSFTAGDIYYKADKNGITEVVCDNDLRQAKSTAEVIEFLKNLNFD